MEAKREILLERYVKTAQALSDGKQLPADQLAAFQGETGILLAEIYEQLWTKEELDRQMRELIDDKCRKCKQDRALDEQAKAAARALPQTTIKQQLGQALVANMRTLIVCATIIVTAAIIWDRVAALTDLVKQARQAEVAK